MSAYEAVAMWLAEIGSTPRPECDHTSVPSETSCPHCGCYVIPSRIERLYPSYTNAMYFTATEIADCAEPREPWQEPNYVPEWATPRG